MQDFTEVTIDRIHHLTEQSMHLRRLGYFEEAMVLQIEAEQHAEELRGEVHCYV